LLIATTLLVLTSPEERTLGQGIKTVYVHVAVTWTAMLLISSSGIIGLIVAITNNHKFYFWLAIIRPVAFGFYFISTVLGAWSSKVNWGAVGWTEPRMQATFQILAVATLIIVVSSWIGSIRVQGILATTWFAFMLWAIFTSPLVLHPSNPIMTSSSSSIKFAFFASFGLVMLISGWFIWYLRSRQAIYK
jgi:hypothetical protein